VTNQFVELTRVDADQSGTAVIVNLGNVAWIEPSDNGTSRLIFAVGMPRERANSAPLSMLVRETADEIALLAGVVRKTDGEAIAQAWIDQSARRERQDEDE
jgi:hypothetical protein